MRLFLWFSNTVHELRGSFFDIVDGNMITCITLSEFFCTYIRFSVSEYFLFCLPSSMQTQCLNVSKKILLTWFFWLFDLARYWRVLSHSCHIFHFFPCFIHKSVSDSFLLHQHQYFINCIYVFFKQDWKWFLELTHYSKSQIFVQKFNFDKTPTF